MGFAHTVRDAFPEGNGCSRFKRDVFPKENA
jgi:hypothetical protein